MQTTTNLDAATTILSQLGGNSFLAMTGARDLLGDEATLQFKLPRGAKDGCNAVRVELDPSDTYTVRFYRIRGLNIATLAEVSMVYADSLRQVFESQTGLYTSL